MHYLLIILLGAQFSLAENFFQTDYATSKSIPSFASYKDTTLSIVTSNQQVHFNTQTTLNLISPNLFGNNSNFYLGKEILNNPDALKNLRNTGMKHMRLPGGNGSNTWLWDQQIPQGLDQSYLTQIKSSPVLNWTLKMPEYYALADSIGAELQPCVNYSISRYFKGSDSVQSAASYAADWVRDLKTQGRKASYWEVGNENYGQWQSGYVVNGDTLNGADYGRDFRVFADSMKNANPNIKVGAVIYPTSTDFRNWSAQVLPELHDKADFLIMHEYFTYKKNINDVTAAEVIKSLSLIKSDRANINTMISKYMAKDPTTVPVMVSEYNLRCGMKQMTFLAPVFQTMALQEFIKNGFNHVNIWDIANAYTTDGDHGMLSRQNPDFPDYTPYPSFYGYWLSNKWLGSKQIDVQSTDTTVRWYGSLFDDGNQGFIAVNPNPKPISFNLYSDRKMKQIRWHILSADSLLSPNLRINGIPSSTNTPGPERYDTIPPYQAVINEEYLITVPSFSAMYGIITTESSVPIQQKLNKYTLDGHRLYLDSDKNHLIHFYNGKGQLQRSVSTKATELDLSKLALKSAHYLIQICSQETKTCSKNFPYQHLPN